MERQTAAETTTKTLFVKTWGVDRRFNQCQVSLMRVRLSQGWISRQEKKKKKA